MTLTKITLISILLFLIGIGIQTLEVNNVVNNTSFLYIPLYIISILTVPLYSLYHKIKK